MADPTPDVDQLRARLRELGYLDAGVNRFVLGPIRGGRGLWSVAWRSSARIGLLAALLLGPSAAVALGVRLPGLVTGARDAAVLAVYLGALFGAAVALLALAASVLLGWLASRPGTRASVERAGPRLARAAGAFVALSCLAYLVLWWRTVNPAGTVWSAGTWTWPVLGLSTAISMLLGHAVAVSALAFVARGAEASRSAPRLPSRSWRLTVATGAIVFLGGATMLFLTTRGETLGPSRQVPLARVQTGLRLTVIAIDGLDLAFLDRLAATGRTPTLARLAAGGARLSIPASDEPDPARTWTSLATGQPADVHGVTGIEARSVSGIAGTVPAYRSPLAASIAAATDLLRLTRPTLTTGLQRRSKTFWEVASDYGLRTAVVNWWATWPAPSAAGIVLSDRATLRLERGDEQDAEIAPESLYTDLRPVWPALRDEARRRLLAAFEGTNDGDVPVLRRAAEQDGLPAALATRVFTGDQDLRAIYLPGLDIAQHSLVGTGGGGLPASALAARVEALERYYVFLDRLLEPLAADTGGGHVLALVSDPGRAASRGHGLLSLTGAALRVGETQAGAAADVAPTLLYLLGVPTSRELPGRPRTDLAAEAFAARVPALRTDTYGSRLLGPRPPGATPLDRDALDRLRSLGYVR